MPLEIPLKKLKIGLSMTSKKLAIYAIHPIMYQTPIFAELDAYIKKNKLAMECSILFGDDLSLKETHFIETNVIFKPDTPFLLDGYKYTFLKNYTKDARSGFFSRINPEIIYNLYKNRYDAILIHGYESLTAWLALLAAKLTGTKVIWRGEAVLRGIENNKSLKQRMKRYILKFFFKACDAVLYSCTGNKEYLKFYGVENAKLFSIPCAVNNDFFQAEKLKYQNSHELIKQELGIVSNDIVILFSARFTKRKRPLDLLNALLLIDHSNITILFVGDGPERQVMENFVVQNNIKAIFTGFKNQSEMSKFYSIADIDIVISDYDPSPKAMNEAMNFEMPIIVTDVIGTAYDLVEEGKNGFIIKVGDTTTLAQKINYFNLHREMLETFGKASFEKVQLWNYAEDAKGIFEAFNYVKKKNAH